MDAWLFMKFLLVCYIYNINNRINVVLIYVDVYLLGSSP